MKQALREARKGLGRTSPNPAVGAVIVRRGEVVSRGYHRRAGLPHAEAEALNKLGNTSPGDSLYVTLEPCNHFGRTPPCVDAIIKSGIKEVVIGVKDPNPKTGGKSIAKLRRAGIKTSLLKNYPSDEGALKQELKILNEPFEKYAAYSIKKNEDLSYSKWGKRLNKYFRHIDLILSPDLYIIGGGASKKLDKYKDQIEIEDISIGSEEFKNKEDKVVRVSAIEIILKKK